METVLITHRRRFVSLEMDFSKPKKNTAVI